MFILKIIFACMICVPVAYLLFILIRDLGQEAYRKK